MPRYVTLEDTVRNVLRDASSSLKGPVPRSKKGRIDITTWWANETPRVLIELKKAKQGNSINNDAKRLRQILGRGGSHREGLIIVYTSAAKPITIDNRFKNMAANSKTVLACRMGTTKYVGYEGNYWYWDVACFQVKV